jgi:hypothetical protein
LASPGARNLCIGQTEAHPFAAVWAFVDETLAARLVCHAGWQRSRRFTIYRPKADAPMSRISAQISAGAASVSISVEFHPKRMNDNFLNKSERISSVKWNCTPKCHNGDAFHRKAFGRNLIELGEVRLRVLKNSAEQPSAFFGGNQHRQIKWGEGEIKAVGHSLQEAAEQVNERAATEEKKAKWIEMESPIRRDSVGEAFRLLFVSFWSL